MKHEHEKLKRDRLTAHLGELASAAHLGAGHKRLSKHDLKELHSEAQMSKKQLAKHEAGESKAHEAHERKVFGAAHEAEEREKLGKD